MRIGLFFGGRSPEHDISIITGELIIAGLRGLGHEAVPVYLGKDGGWYLGTDLGSIEFFQQKDRSLKRFGGWQLSLASEEGLVFRRGMWGKKVILDLAFPAFHGRNGEDGTIQGLFELLDVPYAGCDVTSSAITMDKVLTKLLYERYKIPTAPFVYFIKPDWHEAEADILRKIKKELRFPLMVKPARLGSSIGMAKAENERELTDAIEVALHYDDKVLVEDAIQNLMDVTCAVLGDEDPRPSLLQESLFSSGLLSYEEKYLNKGGTQLGKAEANMHIPARLDAKTTAQTRELAVRIFTLFGCSGIARVDFLYDTKKKRLYANEINTLPGTLYHHLWKASGVSLEELLTELIRVANARHARAQRMTTTFESSVLDQVGMGKKLRPKLDQ